MTSKLHLLSRFRIVLCQPSHPGNIGSTARAMKVMGLHDLKLVNPEKFPDNEANALACGAVDILENAQTCSTLEEALTGCTLAIGLSARKRQLSHRLVSVREAASEARELLLQSGDEDSKIALVFGTEMSGLSNAELDRCQLLAMIPTDPGYWSLNLAAAVQVMCYEVRMALLDEQQPMPHAGLKATPATNDEVEMFYRHLEQTLTDIGFLNPHSPRRLMQRLRRMYARTALEKEEVNILRGILTLTQHPRPPED
jgi:tRNA/rRNA methyltransferase